MRIDSASLLDIEGAAQLILQFSSGMSRADFDGDVKTQKAVLHEITVLGEAVKRLTDAFRARHPEVPWRIMAGMRGHVTHEYDDVDLDEIWQVIVRDIPDLLELIAPLRHELGIADSR